MKHKSFNGLAKALEENDWVASKTTEKVMAIMAGMQDVPWEKIKVFTLRWDSCGGEIVPIVNLMMQDGKSDEVKIELDDALGEKEQEI